MSEPGFLLFSAAFPVAEELAYAACLVLFLRPFLPVGRRRGGLCLMLTVDLLLCLLCDRASAPQGTFCLVLTVLLAALSGALGLGRGAALLLALLYWNAKNASGLVAASLDFIGTQLWLAPAEVPEEIRLRSAVLLAALLLSHAALLAGMLCVLQRRMQKRSLPLRGRELCYLGVMPAAGVLFGQMIARLLYERKDGELLQLYERHPAFLAAAPALALLFCAGAWLAIAAQQGMAAMQEERAAFFVERQQTQMLRARIHEMERLYARIRQMKHDMRGHLANIKGLASRGEYAALDGYIAKMDAGIGGFGPALQTGNPVTDVIVSDAQRRSLDLGIRFQADFHFPVPGAYDAFDVGIILQNLLQNALEACEKADEGQRFIALTGRRTGRFFLIEVKNSFAGGVVFGQDGLPATTKRKDASMHGIGLSSVRREAEKYMGGLELNADRQIFSAVVLLQERSNL